MYSTSEYCAPVWCRRAHTRLIGSVFNDAMHIVTGCMRPTPILAGIKSPKLRRGATLSLAYRSLMDPKHLLYQLMVGPATVHEKRLRSRHPFVPPARQLLNSFSCERFSSNVSGGVIKPSSNLAIQDQQSMVPSMGTM